MHLGLLGKANVGKSTFFSAATQTAVATGNFPFTTIDPNVGVAHVRVRCACTSFEGMAEKCSSCSAGDRFIPVSLIDVAGLVPGAHEGKGLGNKFLDEARQAEALIHIVDISGSTDIQGQPVAPGTHDPLEDVEFVRDEFDQWFAQILQRQWQAITKEVNQKTAPLHESIAKRLSGLGIAEARVRAVLQEKGLASKPPGEWGDEDVVQYAASLRAASKPILIAANKADQCADTSIASKITESQTVLCSAEMELLLRKAESAGIISYVPGSESFEPGSSQATPAQQKALDKAKSLLAEIGTTGVQGAINGAVFGTLGLIAVYPVEDETRLCNKDGQVLPEAKLLRPGSTPKDLAGAVHADLARGFLHAIDCRTKQRIGAEHKLKDGDVVKIVSAASRG